LKNRSIATPNPREEDMDEGKEAEDSNLAIKKCRIDISTKVIASTNVDVNISTH
jgi:hypothetical protein